MMQLRYGDKIRSIKKLGGGATAVTEGRVQREFTLLAVEASAET